jgi:multidrug efflux system outer membrane protein
MRGLLVAGVAGTVVLTGCLNLGPDYERPEVDVSDSYMGESTSIVNTDLKDQTIANLRWWDVFNDPQLQKLIGAAIEENRDLRAAVARVNEARARLGVTYADQFPTLDAGGSAGRGNTAEQFIPDAGIDETYVLSAEARYEVDFWGRYRRGTEAARAELLASEEGQRVVLITLISDVASTYLLLRDLDARVSISEDTLEARHNSTSLIRARFEKGTVPLLDVNQAEIEEADAMARLASLRRQAREAENLLSVLIGSSPRSIIRGRALDEQMFLIDVPAGLPSELLERRPDIRASEQRLAAATARIGVAKALRFPSISLTANGGYISDDLDDLIESDSKIWDVSVDILGPIFDAGKRRSQVEAEIARTEQALNEYEQTILEAMREVEDSLVGIRYYRDEYIARVMQVKAATSASELSRARYDGGITDYLEVLDSDRSLFDAQLQASDVSRLELVSVVSLYKALGGGWLQPQKSQQVAETSEEPADEEQVN